MTPMITLILMPQSCMITSHIKNSKGNSTTITLSYQSQAIKEKSKCLSVAILSTEVSLHLSRQTYLPLTGR
jgi:hypothetical protein